MSSELSWLIGFQHMRVIVLINGLHGFILIHLQLVRRVICFLTASGDAN